MNKIFRYALLTFLFGLGFITVVGTGDGGGNDGTGASVADPDGENNTFATADYIILDSFYSYTLYRSGDNDYLRVDVPSSGTFSFETSGITDTDCFLYDSNQSSITSNRDSGELLNCKLSSSICSGTFYIRVTTGDLFVITTNNYSFQATHTPNPLPIEPVGDNDSFSTADPINLCDTFDFSINPSGDRDFLTLDVTSRGTLNFQTTGSTDTVCDLYGSGQLLITTDDDSGTGNNCSISNPVTPGIYFIRVHGFSSSTGDYSFQAQLS
jgi:Bacterial pre-peptidase C-terminal domain